MQRHAEALCGKFDATRRGVLRTLLVVGGIVACMDCGGRGGGTVAAEAKIPGELQRPRNVLIVALDTLRPDHLSFGGSSRETAPRLAELARESVVFDDAQSAAPVTAASLCSLMTSLYPEVHRVEGARNPGRLSPNVSTLADVLARHAYATAAFTEGAYASTAFGLGKGFQTFPPAPEPGDSGSDPRLASSRLHANVDRTIAWLRDHRAAPFFLFFHTYEIHAPYWASDDDVRRFRPDFDEARDHARVARAIERWNRERSTSPEDALAMLEHLYQCPLVGLPELVDPDGFARAAEALHFGPEDAVACDPLLDLVRDLYDASIRYTDRELERLWNALDDLDLARDTLVVVVSDHGEGLGQHREMQHSNVLFDEALRVLLMIRAPDAGIAPRHVADLVRTVDVMPTVLDLLHIDDDESLLQGRSLVPLMRGESDPERIAFSHARNVAAGQNPQYAVRSGRWRLIDEPAIRRCWLYDSDADPSELLDVSAAHADVVAELRGLLADQAARDLALRERIGGTAGPGRIDARTLGELRTFGYTGDGSGSDSPEPGMSRAALRELSSPRDGRVGGTR